MVVREDSMTLYGFAEADERDLFELVQAASGIGPKIAQAVVSVLSPDALRAAIASENIPALTKVPGIGRKGATRMAYQVLSMSDQDAAALAGAIQNAHTKLHRCRVCQNYTEAELCPICASAKRDRSVICVVETPRDVQAFERTREYHGMYHVLHGLISPMDGIGAEQLTVKELLARLGDGEVKEVIMAMNPTVEGEATAMYLAKLIKPLGIKTTRLAYGLPVGASLEYTDETTLYRALSGRGEL